MAKKNPKKRTADEVYRDCRKQSNRPQRKYGANWVGYGIVMIFIALLISIVFILASNC